MTRKAIVVAAGSPSSMISEALDGHGTASDPDVECGQCETVLVRRLPANATLDLRVVCFGCGAVNDLNQAAAN